MTSLHREMDRLFERFVEPRWTTSDWWPRMDLSETKDGEKRLEKEEKDERMHRVERAYGTFARSFRLPASADVSRVTAEFKDGELTVTLPKTPAAKGTTIPVKTP
jgi:hypothetical protein